MMGLRHRQLVSVSDCLQVSSGKSSGISGFPDDAERNEELVWLLHKANEAEVFVELGRFVVDCIDCERVDANLIGQR